MSPRITRLVEETLRAKPPIQRMADKAFTSSAFGICCGNYDCLGLVANRASPHSILGSRRSAGGGLPLCLGLAILGHDIVFGRQHGLESSRNPCIPKQPPRCNELF